ncbi:DUF1573 domain-containing protein [Sphingobacterium sp. lm-10]|uniref:DUF1573 domain-containing protein n=1 Tax=Sphingobacterium sp. lm-10 TaxID=2944904 RepID=UPI002020762F|nr:DUF1573 domain-containing protein [Sphingobacterium sp. lm-10]MCL7986754.1 DUF1573 domain-containing protein [Sphingobacterium sp. lm-10]
MKKISSVIVAFVVLVGLTSMSLVQGTFKFSTETHDFGKIPQNKPASFEFTFTNDGDSPIIISEVRPTCGCSVADFTKAPVKPGETGAINVTYDASVKGPFTKSFIVKSNTNTPVKNLTIKGNVE